MRSPNFCRGLPMSKNVIPTEQSEWSVSQKSEETWKKLKKDTLDYAINCSARYDKYTE